MAEVEAALLAGRGRRYVQIPTAAAPEGEASLRRWIALGIEQARRIDADPVPLMVETREHAENPTVASMVDGAGLIYLSGGDPAYLASTLRGTRLAAAVVAAWENGAALAGCSAGAIALTDWVPRIRQPAATPLPGLAVVPHLRVIPHFDRFAAWRPDLPERYLAAAEGATVVGIDEETAMVGGPEEWEVHGRQSVWVLTPDGRQEHPAGSRLRTPIAAP